MLVENVAKARTGRKRADVAVVQLSAEEIFDQMILQLNDLRLPCVIGEIHRGVEQFAKPDVSKQPTLLLVKWFEKVVVDIQGKEILMDCEIDAPAHFAAQTDLRGINRSIRPCVFGQIGSERHGCSGGCR